MERRWVGPGGYEVVGALRAGRQVLRVRRHGWLVADCSSVAEVARHVDLADLCEVVVLPAPETVEKIAEARTSSRHR
ncbi:transposase [Nonomuraea sp. NPDC050783]|uniref:transposase n=1 Tax=Nonomuraea sp. NPDC050783 TaxID=3154634 RepID=UPI0034670D1C